MKEDFTIPSHILASVDTATLMTRMSKADWYYDYTEDPVVWKKGRNEINGIKETLLQLSKLENGKDVANYLWKNYVPEYSVHRPEFLDEVKNNLSSQNSTTMNEKNYDFLVNQLKYTGFGEDLKQQLKEKIEKQEPEFTLGFLKDYGKDETVATLQFRKSAESDMYFFNRYSLMLKTPQQAVPIKQTFYVGKDEANITLKEAYNMMNGRAVYKDKLTNSASQEYKAWLQIDFKVTDKNGNYKLHPYNENYGFDLEKALKAHVIKEMGDEQTKTRLIESLERGNRQSVTMTVGDSERKLFIEASPRFKSLNIYDESGKKLKPEDLNQKNVVNESEKQFASQSEKQTKRQGQKQGSGSADGGEPEPAQKKSKRKRQSIN